MPGKQSLDKLARAHYDRLFRAALFLCNDASVAEDLVQETFLAAIRSLGSFEGRSSHYTWLYGILLNKFRAWLRRRDGRIAIGDLPAGEGTADAAELIADEGPGAEQNVARREAAEVVRQALDELPAHHRSVLVLRYLERMSYQEVADTLGCSLGTVKSRIHYALRKIGGKLKGRPDIIP